MSEEKELYEILSNVELIRLDSETPVKDDDVKVDIDFVLKDGRIIRRNLTAHQFLDIGEFILHHKELASTKIAPMKIFDKDLR